MCEGGTAGLEAKVHVWKWNCGTTSRWGARWLSGRVSDSGARGPGFETYRRRVVSLSKTLPESTG